MSDAFFFGYGSLVNRSTHGYAVACPARLRGWSRAWRHTGLRDLAFLTAVPDPGAEIEGLLAGVPGGDWAALDDRESGYDRHLVSDAVVHVQQEPMAVQVYAVPATRALPGNRRHPILLSYLDVVVQGFLREFGPDGAARFFETTSGWEAPVLDDRASPRYPRHRKLTGEERDTVDAALERLGSTRIREK